jgi:hypothetical protein
MFQQILFSIINGNNDEMIVCHLSLCFDRYEWDTGLAFVKALHILAWMIDPGFSWNCEVVGYLQENKIYILFREIICALPVSSVSALHLSFLFVVYICAFFHSRLVNQIH